MDFKDLIVTSWQKMVNHIGPILLITFIQLVLIIITIGTLAPVTMAGYVHSLMRIVLEDRPPEVRDLFSQMRLFLPLFLFSVLVVLAVFIGFMLLVLPGFAVIAFISFGAFYLIPFMIEEKLGLIDALKASWNLAVKTPISDQFVVVIIYVAIMSLGSSLPFAFLVTQPMATFIMIFAYWERIGKSIEQPLRAEPVTPVDSVKPDSHTDKVPDRTPDLPPDQTAAESSQESGAGEEKPSQ